MEKFSKIIKITCLVVLVILFAAVIIRIVIMTDKSKLSTITPNEKLAQAYNQDNNLNIVTHNVYDEISKQGFFAAYALVYIEDIKQMQFTLRYNDSIYSYNDFAIDAEFVYCLYNSKTGELTYTSSVTSDEKLMYNYRRVVFDNIDVSDGADYFVYVYTAYQSSMAIEDAFDNLPIHYASQEWKGYRLSSGEKETLKNFK